MFGSGDNSYLHSDGIIVSLLASIQLSRGLGRDWAVRAQRLRGCDVVTNETAEQHRNVDLCGIDGDVRWVVRSAQCNARRRRQ